jgi:hypothetical protein
MTLPPALDLLDTYDEAVRVLNDAGYMHSITSPEVVAAQAKFEAARTALREALAPLRWTRDPIASKDFYWVRDYYANGKPAPGKRLAVLAPGNEDGPLDVHSNCILVSEFHEWAGPLPEPGSSQEAP